MLTVIIPCCDRPSLEDTLKSTEKAEKVIIVGDGDCPLSKKIASKFSNVSYYEIDETGDFGASQRNFAMRLVKTPLISFLDDDDVYVKEGVERIISYSKLDCINLFKVKIQNKLVWDKMVIEYGNLTTGGIVVPNSPEKLGVWTCRYGTDYDFFTMTYNLMGKKVNYVDFILTITRPHENG